MNMARLPAGNVEGPEPNPSARRIGEGPPPLLFSRSLFSFLRASRGNTTASDGVFVADGRAEVAVLGVAEVLNRETDPVVRVGIAESRLNFCFEPVLLDDVEIDVLGEASRASEDALAKPCRL